MTDSDADVNEVAPELNELFEEIPFSFFRTHQFLPLEIDDDGTLKMGVIEGNYDPQTIDNLSLRIDRSIDPVFMEEEDISRTLNQLEGEVLAGQTSTLDSLSSDTVESYREQVDSERQRIDTSEEAPIANQINSILADAVINLASDIHFEPTEDQVVVRYRRNGVLRDHRTLPRDIHPGLISRIKVMANLDIAEQLKPQDGRMNLEVADRQVDVRVSIVPTVHGERAVLRILNRETLKHSMAELGMNDQQVKTIRELINEPDGIILVTGPTGSGKTTSLYCFLSELEDRESNIMTLEDPVEYNIGGINQIEINPQQGMGFSTGLRSVLRQDPDIIMVGEIRDHESAQLAVHASLTGHLVFSTLHTRSSAGALSRLADLGLDPYLIGAGLSGVLAQRLLRTLCEHCKEQRNGEWVAVGCEECRDTGYEGRTAVFEILVPDDEVINMLEKEEGQQAIESHLANNTSFEPLEDQARELVDRGITTRGEVKRVLNV